MSAQRHHRNEGRRTAVQLLYAAELTDAAPDAIAEGGEAPEEVVLDEYALRLLAGVAEHKDDIDARIAAASENWAVSRMPVVDKCILRLAIFEMLYVDEVPVGVSINEAVELAKDFGGEDESHRFVNGVLGKIAQDIEAACPSDVSEEPASEAAGTEGE